eukprot:SAG11_NODE_17214_length_525_cov_0.715962_1_plen_54_part_10
MDKKSATAAQPDAPTGPNPEDDVADLGTSPLLAPQNRNIPPAADLTNGAPLKLL